MAAGVSSEGIGVDEVRIISLAGERGFLFDVLLKFLNFR